MLNFILFTSFLTVFILTYAILTTISRKKIQIENRVEQIVNIHLAKDESTDYIPFSERTIKPFYDYISKLLLKITPKNKIVTFKRKLEKAGLLKNSTTERWVYIKSMGTFILALIFAIFTYLIEPNVLKSLAIFILIIVSVNVIFNFYIATCITKRKKQILKDLPFTLDLITVSVEAGLSFDGAMVRVINNISGELCDEFAKSLKETRMGIQRKIALRNMSERCEVKELSMLITSLIQADEMGISLGKVLRIEASNLREHRKQVAREKAMKAPIKMLFPLIFFIFPSIFIIILGPAVIKMMVVFRR